MKPKAERIVEKLNVALKRICEAQADLDDASDLTHELDVWHMIRGDIAEARDGTMNSTILIASVIEMINREDP